MDKKPTEYTYEEKESGMVSEPSAAAAYNQPAVHMEVSKSKIYEPAWTQQKDMDPELIEIMREQEEARNDPAWAEWAKGLSPEEWAKLGDCYDSMDEDDPTQWTDARDFFAELETEMKEYARTIGKDF